MQHDGNAQASDEEIDKVAAVFSELRGTTFPGFQRAGAPPLLRDFLFISPYNLQVKRLRARLPDGARVGSVDKFQGQEAPVTIFSLGSSFGEYGSRGLSFLLDRNRINVAISRAQCLAVVVGDPRIAVHRSLFHSRDGIDQSLLPPSRTRHPVRYYSVPFFEQQSEHSPHPVVINRVEYFPAVALAESLRVLEQTLWASGIRQYIHRRTHDLRTGASGKGSGDIAISHKVIQNLLLATG